MESHKTPLILTMYFHILTILFMINQYKIPWFQSPPTSFPEFFRKIFQPSRRQNGLRFRMFRRRRFGRRFGAETNALGPGQWVTFLGEIYGEIYGK
jgi:hypothetical protein